MAWKVDERIPKDHLKKSMNQLIIVANIGPNMAVLKIYDVNEEDSLKLKMTLSNLGDIKEQICQLWQQMNFLLQQYCTQCKSYFSNEISYPIQKSKLGSYIHMYIISVPIKPIDIICSVSYNDIYTTTMFE